MIYFIIILTVIIGISFIVWYSHQQDRITDTPVRPFLKDKKGILDERKKEIVNEILSVFKERFDDTCEIGYLDCKLKIYSTTRFSSTGKYKKIGFYTDDARTFSIEIGESFKHSTEELIHVLNVVKNGVVKHNLAELIEQSIWWYNDKDNTYINLDSGLSICAKTFKMKCCINIFSNDYTKEQLDEFTPCEDPHKTHWEYFLKLEMLAKKQREVDCHKYVDEILQKQITYNDLNLQYQMLPSAPIIDVESFRNFCKVVHEDAKYEDYEIQNYLLLKKSMQ